MAFLSFIIPSLVADGTFEDFKLICLQLPLKLSLVGKMTKVVLYVAFSWPVISALPELLGSI